ncbi:S8 family serine peptidase [Nonomuraea sp. NPDC046570]|uniref:S53 family peptidase n=1 Tax=Nonomuraea sp. NPDC046570 TaxID=3155255 RepID=UPI0033D78BC8
MAVVIAFDYPTAEQDLAVYRRTFGLPQCTTANGCFRKINQNGGSVPPPSVVHPDWALEAALDIDAVSAACPRCNILLVEANDNTFGNLLTAVDRARLQGARFISMSWGAGENPGQPLLDSHFNHPGIAFVAAAGNVGFQTSWPSTSPHVTAAGGTTLNFTQQGGFLSETGWSNGGSGCSRFQEKPSFQSDPGCPRRTTVDISAVANPASGLAVYTTTPTAANATGWLIVGGTSLSSPLIAGMYALAGTPRAGTFPNSYPYAHPGAFQDIVVGSNGTCGGSYLCTAVRGYDGLTGIGAPRGVDGLRAPLSRPMAQTQEH